MATTLLSPPAVSDDEAAAGPPSSGGRDRHVDLLRGLAIVAVAIGHWLVVVPSYQDGRFDGVNALATVPLMHWLSWLFQVMPLFFIVGGYANAASWQSARRRGEDWSTWVRGRHRRLLRPTLVFVAVWVVLGVALRSMGVDPELVHTLAWLVVVPLWFLAVYVIVVALAPPTLWLHDQFGVAVPIVLAVLATFIDSLRLDLGMEMVAYANFLFVFLFCQQLGFFWRAGSLDRSRVGPWAMFLGGLGSLWLLTHVGPYPVSMVGVPGEAIANNAPPTVTFVALGLAQIGLALLLRPLIVGWLERKGPWTAVVGVNAHALTIHVWHFTALLVVAVIVLPLGIVPTYEDGTAAWWLTRWLAVPVLTVPLAALVWLFGRIERRSLLAPAPEPTSPPAHPMAAAAATALATLLLAGAFLLITVGGLSLQDAPAGLPVAALTLLTTGTLLTKPPKAPQAELAYREGPIGPNE